MQSIASLMSIGSAYSPDVGNLDDFDDEVDINRSNTAIKISELASQFDFLSQDKNDSSSNTEIQEIKGKKLLKFYFLGINYYFYLGSLCLF